MAIMFNDKRSKKIILVAHCILNQNAKLDQCAHYPGPIKEAAWSLMNADIGIVQLPCPELLYLGLDRETAPGAYPSVADEDTRIAARMREEKAKCFCRELIQDVLRQVTEYREHGFEIVGLLGINGSPTCGVDTTWTEDRELEGPGVFIEMLREELERMKIPLKMVGIKALYPMEALCAIENLFNG